MKPLRKKKKETILRKAIKNIKLNDCNDGKVQCIDDINVEYHALEQAYIDYLVKQDKGPDKFDELPEVETKLSERWKRCCFQQAAGTFLSWWEKGKPGKAPVLENDSIQCSVNILSYEPGKTTDFDWLKLSTLNPGHPVLIPIKLHPYAVKSIKYWGERCSGILLYKRNGQWECQFVLKKKIKVFKEKPSEVVGIDIGMVTMVSTSEGSQYGQVKEIIAKKVEQQAERTKNKQKLNSCLKKNGKEEISLKSSKAERYVRNEIGRALNALIKELPNGVAIAFENLSVADMRMKSHGMNRRLRASQLGYIRDKLEYKCIEHDLNYKKVQPAYSSQTCPRCGFVDKGNRPSQAKFCCLNCGFEANADHSASVNLAERFSDDELNGIVNYREVKSLLKSRFKSRFPDVDFDAIASKGSTSVRLAQVAPGPDRSD